VNDPVSDEGMCWWRIVVPPYVMEA